MKRRDDNRQLRPEEVEALNEVSEEAGSFSRASEEVLATRRIVKSKRSSLPSSSSDAASGGANPFAAFGSLTQSSAYSAVPKANPFSSLPTLKPTQSSISDVTTKSAATGLGFGQSQNQSPIKQNPATFGPGKEETAQLNSATIGKSSAAEPISNGVSSSTVSSNSKIQKLNKSFLSWMEKQIVDHPVSVWSSGLQDYLKYADKIAEQTPASATSTSNPLEVSTTAQPDTVPTPAASSWKLSSTSATAAPTNPSFGFNSSASKKLTAPGDPSAAPATTALPPKPTFGFNSSTLKTATPLETPAAPAKPSFGFLSTAVKPFTALTTATAKPALGGFTGFTGIVNGAAANPGRSAPVDDEGGVAGDEDEDAMPELEPEEVLKNAADNDEILHETACKLFRFHKPADPKDKAEWKESGKGTLSLTKEPGASKKRVLIRNTLGKISVNAFVCQGMNFKKSGKNGIQFMTVNEEGTLVAYMAKVKPEVLDDTFCVLSKAEMEA